MFKANIKKIKVLHAPTVVSGNPIRLSLAERKLGLFSLCVSISVSTFNFPADKTLSKKNRFLTLVNLLYWGLIKALSFDVLHFNFGQSFLPLRPQGLNSRKGFFNIIKLEIYHRLELLDVKILSLLGKVVAVTYQGDDARQGDYCRLNHQISHAHHVDNTYYPEFLDVWKRERIKIFTKYADLIYALNPDLLNVLPSNAKFLPYSGLDLLEWKVKLPQDGNDFIPNIIHAPSNRIAKGTKFLEQALERLGKEGVLFNFCLVENLDHEKAMQLYLEADFVVDQLLAGFYGGLSMELMTLGKPSICYIRQEDMKFLPEEMVEDMPIINATPETIYDVLKLWLTTNKNLLREQGVKSRKYVEKWHDPLKVAAIVKADSEEIIMKKKKRFL